VLAGQFQVSDPLFKRELRLTFEDYHIYRTGRRVTGQPHLRPGLMMTYGFDFGLGLVGEVLNGNGIVPAEDRVFDVDSEKAAALRLSQSFGWPGWGRSATTTRSARVRRQQRDLLRRAAMRPLATRPWS